MLRLVTLAVLACASVASADQVRLHQQRPRRNLLAPSGQVSILDGTLPSPDLTPQPQRSETTGRSPAEAIKVSSSHGSSCGAGCIAGSVVGGTVGLALILGLIFYLCCRRSAVKDEVTSTSDMELMDNPLPPSKGSITSKLYNIGEEVFCRKGRNCTYGKVTDVQKGSYTVELYDGTSEKVQSQHMAPNYAEGTEVWYTPPDGKPSMQGTIIQADGSYWPPFYQLTPLEGNVGVINTTAECLKELKKSTPAHYITASAV